MITALRFKRRSNGVGSVLSTTHLGYNEGDTRVAAEFSLMPDPPLIKAKVKVFYFATRPSSLTDALYAAARLAAQQRAHALMSSLLFAPMVLKPLARGKFVAVNVQNNYGDLVYSAGVSSPFTEAIILDNCTLESISVIDDDGGWNVALELVFARVADALRPS